MISVLRVCIAFNERMEKIFLDAQVPDQAPHGTTVIVLHVRVVVPESYLEVIATVLQICRLVLENVMLIASVLRAYLVFNEKTEKIFLDAQEVGQVRHGTTVIVLLAKAIVRTL